MSLRSSFFIVFKNASGLPIPENANIFYFQFFECQFGQAHEFCTNGFVYCVCDYDVRVKFLIFLLSGLICFGRPGLSGLLLLRVLFSGRFAGSLSRPAGNIFS